MQRTTKHAEIEKKGVECSVDALRRANHTNTRSNTRETIMARIESRAAHFFFNASFHFQLFLSTFWLAIVSKRSYLSLKNSVWLLYTLAWSLQQHQGQCQASSKPRRPVCCNKGKEIRDELSDKGGNGGPFCCWWKTLCICPGICFDRNTNTLVISFPLHNIF